MEHTNKAEFGLIPAQWGKKSTTAISSIIHLSISFIFIKSSQTPYKDKGLIFSLKKCSILPQHRNAALRIFQVLLAKLNQTQKLSPASS